MLPSEVSNETLGRETLAQLAPSLRPRVQRVFRQLDTDLPTVVASLGALFVLEHAGDLTEAVTVQAEAGVARLHLIYFRRDSRGQWLIEEM